MLILTNLKLRIWKWKSILNAKGKRYTQGMIEMPQCQFSGNSTLYITYQNYCYVLESTTLEKLSLFLRDQGLINQQMHNDLINRKVTIQEWYLIIYALEHSEKWEHAF